MFTKVVVVIKFGFEIILNSANVSKPAVLPKSLGKQSFKTLQLLHKISFAMLGPMKLEKPLT